MDRQFNFNLKVDGRFFRFNAEVLQQGNEVVKLLLTINKHELLLQKKLLLKTGSWGILSSTFEFKKEDAAYTLLRIYKILDEKLGVIKPTYDQQKRNKD